ncbi:MAG: hypothetical protein MGG11_20080 [Trichodesmium sp. MAG_R03]|nr:hypothetical protein [Trichodesmium sp. MAG_R03]
MKQKNNKKAIANKIKKWLQVIGQLNNGNFILAIPTNRLRSIKSLIHNQTTAEQFALHVTQKVQQKMYETERYKEFPPQEWLTHLSFVSDAIAKMEGYLADPTDEKKQSLWELLIKINSLQSDHYFKIHWKTISCVCSGYLLKLDYALRCFVEQDCPYWAYKLARVYVGCYEPRYGSGLIPSSIPMLIEVAEFWCNYYFDCSLSQKFPQEFLAIRQSSI